MIREKHELRVAYETVRMIEEMKREYGNTEKLDAFLKEKKREIRDYYKRQEENRLCIVKDYGIDGYIELFQFPDNVTTYEDAKEWFDENERKSCSYSAYDCTGQAFTGWRKIFVRNGKFCCYHRVCYDV